MPSGIFWSLFHCRIFGIAVLRVILKERCCALLPKARHSGPFLVFSMLGEYFPASGQVGIALLQYKFFKSRWA